MHRIPQHVPYPAQYQDNWGFFGPFHTRTRRLLSQTLNSSAKKLCRSAFLQVEPKSQNAPPASVINILYGSTTMAVTAHWIDVHSMVSDAIFRFTLKWKEVEREKRRILNIPKVVTT